MKSKNGVDVVEVSIFYKSVKMSGQTIQRKKIKNSSAFIPYHGFYNALGIFSQKI